MSRFSHLRSVLSSCHVAPSSGLTATFSPEGEKGLRSRGKHSLIGNFGEIRIFKQDAVQPGAGCKTLHHSDTLSNVDKRDSRQRQVCISASAIDHDRFSVLSGRDPEHDVLGDFIKTIDHAMRLPWRYNDRITGVHQRHRFPNMHLNFTL